jgi:hypothetical protein
MTRNDPAVIRIDDKPKALASIRRERTGTAE